MIVVSKIDELKNQIYDWKKQGKTIGFCPTMGSLHQGHMDLVQTSKSQTDKTIVSIFINPTQFNDPKDFEKYPVNTENDLLLCEKNGADMVFLPDVKTMYPETKTPIQISIPKLQEHLCGRTRPGHFEGVLQIVTKLFHLTEPSKAFFGLKDYQQFRVISAMVENLNFPLEVVGVPTRRETDGLAMSSRNVRLSPKERETASLIPRMFALAKKTILSGEKDIKLWKEILRDFLLTGSSLRIDYLEVVDPIDLQPKDKLEGQVLLAVAVFVGEVRLIDNQTIEIPS
ncbi:pantoate--beta-alanine ligase [Leptospira bandrabouensis]|uniref:pantoate--beta-alanine ligase n=1 Tax=Leptospira bandrabouensis TaxID=2484903 RepID=UPI00223D4AE1|nr:pantoate--beta-alanine ligase [Leptospira bandrabouensis]MCW7458909.1 pantoate--beta-alanine ligase [Leptospira bandrabouensis]MCW7477977.1 pantoate--beta-alanine ligase [Leptospira bandrabouensis]MCW7485901.1 pantoate--beta-alanine ligase [Leptospira bandrabouensis]